MHRSRLPVLMILAAIAACSSRDASEGTAILSTEMLARDTTLVAQLTSDGGTSPLSLPSVCGVVSTTVQPAISNQAQAKELTVQAQNAEMHGDIAEARSLLGRALALDGTSKSAAYHLGRTSEALGDRVAATSAYCRYLALAPTTAESAEARQRLTSLTPAETRTSAGSISENTPVVRHTSAMTSTRSPARRARHQQPTLARRKVASAPVQQSGAASAPERAESTTSAIGGVSEGEVVVAMPRPAPDQPATASRSTGPSRAQSGIVGAAAGAIFGAATGRGVKGAAIGAAAGGILGTMMGRGSRPVVRGIRS